MTSARHAIVHDWLTQHGGAEVVLEELHRMFPAAPVYTSIRDRGRFPDRAGWDIRTNWMDRLPGARRHHRAFLPLYPVGWASTKVDATDCVISNKSGFCHGAGIPDGTVHLCYCLTPTRFVWQSGSYVRHENLPPGARLLLSGLLPWLRHWDRAAADRVDAFVAISSAVRERIRLYYGRESSIIYPPVEVERFRASPEIGDHYLVLSRLVPYKRIDLAVKAFNRLGRQLIVVGEGRDRGRLEAMAGPTVSFRGRMPADEVADLLARSRALVWPGIEDFGIAPVEAMAAGRPVVARRGGGAADTVKEGETGVFFDEPTAVDLARAVLAADDIDWNPELLRRHAARFSRATFVAALGAEVERLQRAGRSVPQAAQALSGEGKA